MSEYTRSPEFSHNLNIVNYIFSTRGYETQGREDGYLVKHLKYSTVCIPLGENIGTEVVTEDGGIDMADHDALKALADEVASAIC